MNIKKKLLVIASIIGYIFTFIYIFFAAIFFSMKENIYWLFFILGVVTFIGSLLLSTVKDRLRGKEMSKTQIVQTLVFGVVSIGSPITFILSLVSLLIKNNDPIVLKPYVIKDNDEDIKEETKPLIKRKNTIVGLIFLVAIFISSFASFLIETSGCKTEISQFYLTKEMSEEYSQPINGKSYVIKSDVMRYMVNVYKPKKASSENKLPAIFLSSGYTRNKESVANFAIELSKRGAVCITFDSAAHGESSYGGYYINSKDELTKAGTADGRWGLNYVVSYIYNNTTDFDYIDRDRLGAAGHSQGGAATMQSSIDLSNGGTYETSILKAIQISGYCTQLTYYAGLLRSNAMLTWGMYEEGYAAGSYENYFAHFVNDANGYGTFNYTNVNINEGYGDMSDGTYRIITRPKTNHFLTVYSSENVERACDFFNEALSLDNPIKGNKQTWVIREITSIVTFAGGFTFIFSLATLLMSLKFFKDVKKAKVNSNVETEEVDGVIVKKPQSIYSRLKFWLSTLLTAVIACLDYLPLCTLAQKTIFLETGAGNYNYFGPCKMLNGVMLWAVVNGLIGLVVFFLPKIIETIVFKIKNKGKDIKCEIKEFEPLKINIISLLKTILLAVILFVSFFGIVELIYLIFHQSMRLILVSVPTITVRSLVAWAMYIPFFFIFYISNSIRVNCGIGFEGFNKPAEYVVAILANSLGLVFILLIQYTKYVFTGSPYWSDTTSINVIFGVTIMMALLPIVNRIFFKRSNQVYLGAIIATMIFIYISVAGTANLIPII